MKRDKELEEILWVIAKGYVKLLGKSMIPITGDKHYYEILKDWDKSKSKKIISGCAFYTLKYGLYGTLLYKTIEKLF